ncbi:hsp70 family protein [Pelagicoccus mobilis]|uniref:Hsp70 family protein n=1 Tax=Pelagicoccus mobilis TaxID=415221 RepID=A0A934S0X5_9BACT|nr:hsp70 family protein [Pelagicoccus mobilis]MBK1877842.1 Hsp70 family protein [Pelagicoccus mobilis]
MNPRYSIGIDLGTTNCALSFLELGKDDAQSQVLPIPQLEEKITQVERDVLPSFLAWNGVGDWTAGLFARNRSRETPDAVIHSAKSWLCHHSVSPEASILPWKSKLVPDAEKLSPIEVSARLLDFLKRVWDQRFSEEAPFVDQVVTITVPASFDAAAQAATLEAAKQADYPTEVRLLEEPQAAFYRWLDGADSKRDGLKKGERILVVDIGGGTSDFSLFQVGDVEDDRPRIERVAVSDHLLLGGDNIDLALAHALESELSPNGEELSVDQWGHLISRARELKEACLSEGAGDDNQLSVSLPSRGSGLLAGTLSTEVSSQLVKAMILEGFFPECSAGSKAEKAEGGLLEWGLPYAVDCAVTRHLAEFLGADARVDRVLFNGGSLSAPLIRERLLEQLAAWQGDEAPAVLENEETYLAVARGAARFGEISQRGKRQIDAGAARAIFLEVEGSASGDARAVCVLPKGAQPGERFDVGIEGLSLRVNQRVAFNAFHAEDSNESPAGSFCSSMGKRVLPALEATIESEGRDSVPVRLVAGVNEVGLLSVACEALESDESWPLEFSLRAESTEANAGVAEVLEVDSVKLAKVARALKGGLSVRDPKASRVFSDMERAAGAKKHEWEIAFCRALTAELLELESVSSRGDSVAEGWLQLAGYLMRPGFGVAGDEDLRARLFRVVENLESRPAKVEVQRLIFLRRVVAGCSEGEQSRIFDEEFEVLAKTKRGRSERIRLLGMLEKVDLERKNLLFEELMSRLDSALGGEGDVGAVLAGLAGLLNRVPFNAGEDRVMSPDCVASLYNRVAKLDWKESRYAELVSLFLRAARVVDDRSLNVPSRLGRKIVGKLEKSGVASTRLLPLQDFVPVSREEKAKSFGEALPPGLLIEGA